MTITSETSERTMRLPDGTRSVQSPYVWRMFVFLSLIALGVCISLATTGRPWYAVAWGVIATSWFGTGMWLWRKHLRYDAAG